MNQTFTKLASDFDEALQEYRDAEHALTEATARRERAAEAMRLARDTMLEAYPELVPNERVVQMPTAAGDWQPPGAGGLAFIEVDDPDMVPDFRERG